MASWHKALLKYALSYTGLLDDKAIDVNNLDLSFGRQSVLELKDVGLNIARITSLAQLPPCLRIETARIISLKLKVPGDFIFRSSIEVDVDGIEVQAVLDDREEDDTTRVKSRSESPSSQRTPQHRKVHQRLHSPTAYDPGGAHIPSAPEIATSFLHEQPSYRWREIETSLAADSRNIQDSTTSESSDGELGTGTATGITGYLASYLQGIMDRMKVNISNVKLNLELKLPAEGQRTVPLAFSLRIGSVELATLSTDVEHGDHAGNRQLKVQEFSFHLIADKDTFSDFASMPLLLSPVVSKTAQQSASTSDQMGSSMDSEINMGVLQHVYTSFPEIQQQPELTSSALQTSAIPDNDDIIDDKSFNVYGQMEETVERDYDIKPGDDNISWGSRRSKASDLDEEIWSSIRSEDNLPRSLVLDRRGSVLHEGPSGVAVTARRRRPVSPYDRNVMNPASWPIVDDAHEYRQVQKSPGSWPTLEQSQSDIVQQSEGNDSRENYGLVDNKATALEATTLDTLPLTEKLPIDHPQGETKVADSYTQDLTQSRIFHHDEAESMYMSAIAGSTLPTMTHPGAWEAESVNSQVMVPEESQQIVTASDSDGSQPTERIQHAAASGNSTPRALSTSPDTPPQVKSTSSERLMYVDSILVWFPKSINDSQADSQAEFDEGERAKEQRGLPSNMPGTFSVYADIAASRRLGTSIADELGRDLARSSPSAKQPKASTKALDIAVGNVRFDIDIPCCKVIYQASTYAATFRDSKPARSGAKASGAPVESQAAPGCSVSLKDMRLAIHERFRTDHQPSSQSDLFLLVCKRIKFTSSIGEKTIQLANFDISLNGHSLLHFDRSNPLASSTVFTEASPDISLTVKESFQLDTRSVVRISMETLPLVLNIDIQAVEESFRGFGGLSGILELGSSIVTDNSERSSPKVNRSPKGVHFQDGAQKVEKPEIKVDCRIGATEMVLRGESCSIRVRTTSFKALYRESGVVASIGHIMVTGPHESQGQPDSASISVDISNFRVEYLPTPQNKDLETLLTLLTPSKDKYDNDDDILIDTLLRQRRKGAVVRVTIGNINAKAMDFDGLALLSALGSELSQLSAVTKYLPEDERPGPLVLIQVNASAVQLPVNAKLGPLRIRLEDFELAHVGLPALFASSIGTLTVAPLGGDELVHPLVQSVSVERLPMIMARMLGNEVDSKVKLKLFNVCLEYSVPIILAMSGLDEDEDPEVLYQELATSVANIADMTRRNPQKVHSDSPTRSSPRKTELILLVHDSAIGLTPVNLPSKALFVLTDAQASTLMPPQKTVKLQLELNKAAIFITDILEQNRQENARGSLNNTAVSQRLATVLSKQGYSSVGSIGRARVSAQIFEDLPEEPKCIEVDFSNDFLLLETCADSTQTLIATLNGLAPPTPPDKQPKYKIEPGITIEEMMSSFTGEPMIKPQIAAETIFDADDDPLDDPDSLLLEPTLDFEPDDLMADSEMTTSLYGPISRIGESSSDRDDPSPSAKEEDFRDIVESLLEDDPFEMPEVPLNSRMGDAALLRDLKKQCRRPVSDELVDLGVHEIDDLGLNALGSGGQPLGSRYRFNTPAARKRKLCQQEAKQTFPFKLRLRNVNAIWNIYDGFDWQRTRDSITNAVEQVEARTEERKARHRQSRDMREEDEPVIGDLLFNSFYIGIPSGNDVQELRRQINRGIDDQVSETELSAVSRPTTYSASGRAVRQRTQRRLKLERSRHHKIGFELKGVSADIVVFPPDSKDIVSSVDIRIKDFEIFDQVPTSTWSKFLTHLESDPAQREMAKPMFHIELLTVRTLKEHSAAEILLHVAVTPLRLHVDHDALDFITRFFEFKDTSLADSGSASEQPFLQRVEIETVDLRLDYKPKRIDYAGLRSGHTSEFMNFITLDAANIQLRHAIVYGLRGFDPLHKTLNDIWMPDVTKNQLPTVLAGLAPVRSLVNIGVSAKEVISIPIREYRKDGRIIRSIQKGAYHFGKTTTSELARFGAKVAIGTQNALQNVEEYLSPTVASASTRPTLGRNPSSEPGWQSVDDDQEVHEQRAISSYANQPLGALPGLAAARRFLEHDLLTARDAFIAVQGEVLESNSPSGVAAVVARHAPVVMLRPLIGATKAIGTTLLGVGNQIDRDNVRRMADKYKSR